MATKHLVRHVSREEISPDMKVNEWSFDKNTRCDTYCTATISSQDPMERLSPNDSNVSFPSVGIRENKYG